MTMTILYGFLKLLETLEQMADVVDCLATSPGAVLLVSLVGYQACIMAGCHPLLATSIAGLLLLMMHNEAHQPNV